MNILLFLTCALFYSFAGYFLINWKKSLHDKLSAIIMLTAGTLYLTMGNMISEDSGVNLREVRYFDWIITVPILTYQMFLFLKENTRFFTYIGSMICVILMLVTGWLGEAGFWIKEYLGVIGTIFSIYTFVALADNIKTKDRKFFFTILGLWMFYPIVYFIPESNYTIIGYSIADISAKIGSSIYIKIKSNKNA